MNYYLATMSILDFSEWLQGELDKREWRPAELAKKSGVSDGAISRFLRGDRKPDPDSLSAIAKALKLPVENVYRAAGLLPPLEAKDEKEKEFEHLLSRVPESVLDDVLQYLRFRANTGGQPNDKKKGSKK